MTTMRLAAVCVLVLIFAPCVRQAHAQTNLVWRVTPVYESPASTKPTNLIIPDSSGTGHQIYSDSYAVIIEEGNYVAGTGFTPVPQEARNAGDPIKSALENRHYHVFIWRDLNSAQLNLVLDDVRANLGYQQQARLFFYYFGHGYLLPGDPAAGPSTPDVSKGFLIPIDTPNPNTNRTNFTRKAVPIGKLMEMAGDMSLKHAFFALEACDSGSLFPKTLGGPAPPNPTGYVLSANVQRTTRQFITAGSARQDVFAGVFSQILLNGLDKAQDTDGYVTGSSLMEYIKINLPTSTTTEASNPESETLPSTALGGDMIIGPTLAVLTAAPSQSQTLGFSTPSNSIVTTAIDGTLLRIHVNVGDAVAPGDTLFELNPAAFLIERERTKALLARATTELQQHRLNLVRMRSLLATNQIAEKDYIDEVNKVQLLDADLMLARANDNSASFKLAQTVVRAPACGKVQTIFVAPGSAVAAGTTVMALQPGCPVSGASGGPSAGLSAPVTHHYEDSSWPTPSIRAEYDENQAQAIRAAGKTVATGTSNCFSPPTAWGNKTGWFLVPGTASVVSTRHDCNNSYPNTGAQRIDSQKPESICLTAGARTHDPQAVAHCTTEFHATVTIRRKVN